MHLGPAGAPTSTSEERMEASRRSETVKIQFSVPPGLEWGYPVGQCRIVVELCYLGRPETDYLEFLRLMTTNPLVCIFPMPALMVVVCLNEDEANTLCQSIWAGDVMVQYLVLRLRDANPPLGSAGSCGDTNLWLVDHETMMELNWRIGVRVSTEAGGWPACPRYLQVRSCRRTGRLAGSFAVEAPHAQPVCSNATRRRTPVPHGCRSPLHRTASPVQGRGVPNDSKQQGSAETNGQGLLCHGFWGGPFLPREMDARVEANKKTGSAKADQNILYRLSSCGGSFIKQIYCHET